MKIDYEKYKNIEIDKDKFKNISTNVEHLRNCLAICYILMEDKDKEIERLNNIINELEKDIKNLYTYGIKNNAEQRDYLLNRLEGLKEYRGSDKE